MSRVDSNAKYLQENKQESTDASTIRGCQTALNIHYVFIKVIKSKNGMESINGVTDGTISGRLIEK
jgi:hypothetical protein